MRRRQLLTMSVLAPYAIVACDGRRYDVCGGRAAPPNVHYSPEGYERVTIERAACAVRRSEVSGAQAAATNCTYAPEGYEGVTIELYRPVERIAADFYSAAGLAQYGITPVAVFGFGQNESPGNAFDSEGVE